MLSRKPPWLLHVSLQIILLDIHMHSHSYDILQLEIPSKDTTYWCSVHLLPEEIRRHEKHMYKVCMMVCTDHVYYNITTVKSD